MTPDATALDYLDHLARDSARFVEVLRQVPSGTRVPACPDWDADDLLWHLAEVQGFWGTIVGRGLTAQAEGEAVEADDRPGDREGLLTLFDQASRELHHHLSATSPDTPAWTWAQEQSVGFIRRRQAHEALIHRLDAELTAGDRTPMDADLSTDGVDEILRVMYGGAPPWAHFTPDPTQTVRIRTTDTNRSWLLTLGQLAGTDDHGTAHDERDLRVAERDPGGPDAGGPDAGATAAATVSGTAADLDCWLWHRPPVGEIERAGEPQVLQRFDQTIAPGIS
ncbi:MAG: maleylpyruvate isomerase family mycothiol-dependent enzyme [Phycicoccus sp.]|nr:maleylpyruvate isomerase family mycothiol-dependent enzyme [Phycicoccus sp.]NMM34252.1 maleylpyruvate isomerase family mycothiol-dependent enzyme [Phycicoccus sp.]